LCEIKTINISDVEACRRRDHDVGSTTDHLAEGFFRKLASDLEAAQVQIQAYCADDGPTRKIIYVIVNFDDSLHEYAEEYERQITERMSTNSTPGFEVIFDIKPRFYTTLS
jgi:hypothetical protein